MHSLSTGGICITPYPRVNRDELDPAILSYSYMQASSVDPRQGCRSRMLLKAQRDRRTLNLPRIVQIQYCP